MHLESLIANDAATQSLQEGGAGQSAPLDQLLAQIGEASELFFFNFVSTVFDARDKIVENGEVNFTKLCEAQADAYKLNSELADAMARRLSVTQTAWGVEYFTRWRDAFDRLYQMALDPALEAEARLHAISSHLDAKLNLYFPAIQGNVQLRKWIPKLGIAWDLGNMAAALIQDDREAFSKATAGLIGGAVGANIILLIARFGAISVGWETVLVAGVASVVGSLLAQNSETLTDGAGSIFDFIRGHREEIPRYVGNYQFGLGTTDSDVISALDADKRYFLVSSDGSDSIKGNVKDDVLEGGGGDDHLEGEGGNDIIDGGVGDDIIVGGGGSDSLEGGAGFDAYRFSTEDLNDASTRDVIYDSDGQGVIKFNDLDIAGTGIGFDNIKESSLGTWETANGEFRLAVVGAGTETQSLLIIRRLGEGRAGGSILIKLWKNGDLGIFLPNFDAAPEPGMSLGGGDDLFGLSGNTSNDNISGLGGNDGLSGNYGNDVLDGGAGSDLIFGGPGGDTLFGGDGDDWIIDGTELVELLEWDDEREEEIYGGLTENDHFENVIAGFGAAVQARGKAWFVYREGDNYIVDRGIYSTIKNDIPWWQNPDPNQHPSGNLISPDPQPRVAGFAPPAAQHGAT